MSERGLAAVTSVALDHGLVLSQPVVLRSLSTVLVRLEPYPIVARALVSGSGVTRIGALGRAIREAGLLSHLGAVDAPAVPVSPLLPPGPHLRFGIPVVAAAQVRHGLAARLDGAALARSLHALHAGLASYPGVLPDLPHLTETAGWLLRPEVQAAVPARARARMTAALSAARGWLAAAGIPVVAVHGDAHSGNALIEPAGAIRWADLEDACRAPAEWDLACLVTTAQVFGGDTEMATAALQAWGDYDQQTLELLVDARAVQVAVWGVVAATVEPRRTRTAERRLAEALLHLKHRP